MPALSGMPIKRQPLNAAAMTNTGQPVPTPPIVAPNLPTSPTAPPISYTPTQVGPAPTATPTGAFVPPTGPDPYQFRVDQANKGAQRSAAAHGTLLSGGFQTALAKLNQGLASEETQNIYSRARDTYALNADTAHRNYADTLAGYTAGTGAQLDAGRLNLSGTQGAYDRTYGAQRDTYGDAVHAADTNANVINVNNQAQAANQQQMNDYRAWLDQQRQAATAAQNAATTAATGTMPRARPLALPAGSRARGTYPGYGR